MAGPAAGRGGRAGDAGAWRGGMRMSPLLSWSFIWHTPVARVGLRLDRPHRAGFIRGTAAPCPPSRIWI